eukprot:3364213-Prymnesium_polylepis.1
MVHGATSSEHISHVTNDGRVSRTRSDSGAVTCESIASAARWGAAANRHQRCVWYLYTIESVYPLLWQSIKPY